MDTLIRFYRMCNLLSLDVAGGAIVCALFFSKLLSVTPYIQGMIALGLTVWVIYTADRLLDVRSLTNAAASERHKFHQQYQKPLWIVSITIGLIVVGLVFFLRPPVLLGGIYLSIVVAFYLLLQKYLKGKEVFVAMLYTAGVMLPSWSVTSVNISMAHYLLVVQLFSVALINLLLFSWFEYESDLQDGHSSIAIRWGKKATGNFLLTLSAINLAITLYLTSQNSFLVPTILFLLMNSVLVIIFKFHSYFTFNSRYRLLGDAIFFIPLAGIFL